jgi:K+-sensing histidine kinase KdpD
MESLTTDYRLKVILAGSITMALVSYLDYLTGYEFMMFAFYFIPVSVVAWHLEPFWVFCMALISGLSWYVADLVSEHQYSHESFRYWDVLVCFLALAGFGLVLQRLRHSLNEQLKARRELAKSIEELTRSTEEVRKLQGQLQIVCAWTHRINVEGKWVALEEFLSNKLHIPISHGISPQAVEEIKQNLKK